MAGIQRGIQRWWRVEVGMIERKESEEGVEDGKKSRGVSGLITNCTR